MSNPTAPPPARQRWALLALLLLTLALRLYRLDMQDVWWDEARNIDVASRPLTQIATAGELDIHPPVYFYLLHGWMAAAGHSAFAIRFLSTAFGLVFVALMFTLGRRIGGFWAGLYAGLGAAFLPFLLGEAQEARMYTVVLAWLAAAAIALLAAASGGGRFDRRWLAFSVFSALALLTHYSAAFALVALWGWAGLWALVARKDRPVWPRLRTVLIAGAVTAVLCLPGLPVALRQVPGYRNANLVVPSVGSFLADLARVYTLGEFFTGSAARPWHIALVALLAGGALLSVYAFARRKPGPSAPRSAPAGPITLVLLWAVLPLVIYYAAIADRGTFATRYISVALPAWLLLAALALHGYGRVHPTLGAAAAVALFAIFVPGLRTDLFDEAHFRDDTRGVIAWLRAETDPDRDIILVDQRYPFGFYYQRWNNGHGGTPPVTPAGETPAQYLFVDFNTLPGRLAELTRDRSRVYTIRWWESDTDPRRGVPFLLRKFGTQLGSRDFRGYTVDWYDVAPGTQFELTDGLHDPRADFGRAPGQGSVRLEGVDLGGRGPGATSTVEETRAPTTPADGLVWAVARWSRLPNAGGSGGVKATLLLQGQDGLIVARDDRLLLNDRHLALSEWGEADRPLTVFALQPAPATPPGRYTLKLSLYDPQTLEPLAVASEAAAGAFVVLGEVDITRATVATDPAGLPLELRTDASWDGVTLLGRGPLAAEVAPGGALPVDLYWEAGPVEARPRQFRLELAPLDGAGEPVSVDLPLGGRYPSASWQPGEVVRQRAALPLPAETAPGSYRLLARPSGGEQGEVELGRVTVAGRAHNFELPASLPHRSGATFAPADGGAFAELLGISEPALAGRSLSVDLFWQARGASPIPYTVSVQLLDPAGVLVAQADQQPGGGAFPTNSWVEGEMLADRYELQLPEGLSPAAYTLIVKLYDPATGQVVPATPSGAAAPQDFVRLAEVDAR